MLERQFQAKLVKELKAHGFTVWKNQQNATTELARPDLLILKGRFWGCLEVKKNRLAPYRPLQYEKVQKYNEMSYARFIYPENAEEVLEELYSLVEERENGQKKKRDKSRRNANTH